MDVVVTSAVVFTHTATAWIRRQAWRALAAGGGVSGGGFRLKTWENQGGLGQQKGKSGILVSGTVHGTHTFPFDVLYCNI